MNTLLRASPRMPYHTDLRRVFEALGGRQREFGWLLTDIELNTYPPGLSYLAEQRAALWQGGGELTALAETYDVQVIWGVLSGFARGVELDLDHLDPYPCAGGNAALWQPGVQIQHPRAQVEIVCWDSSVTLLLSRDDDLTARFRSYFPEAVDLDEWNLRTARRGS